MDLRNFISKDALKLMFSLNGWTETEIREIANMAVFKPDFYEHGYIIAKSKKAVIKSMGNTKVSYKGDEFDSVQDLLEKHGPHSVLDFKDWTFTEEREWVILKNGEWATSFTTLDKLPTTKKYRC